MSVFAKSLKTALLLVLFGIGSMGLSGCDDGRFEEAGEEIDEAGEEMQDNIDDAADDLN
jgi:hypothetical protein